LRSTIPIRPHSTRTAVTAAPTRAPRPRRADSRRILRYCWDRRLGSPGLVDADLLVKVADEASAVAGEVGKAERHVEPEARGGSRVHRQPGNLHPVGDAHKRGAVVVQMVRPTSLV
jgi:hypothetical protein